MRLRLFVVCSMLILAAAFPAFGIFICAIILAIQIALMCLRPIIACLPARLVTGQQDVAVPQFSIHVAIHSEPPALVIRTLRGLLNQDWPSSGYEIIVMDNNTVDPALWKPVQKFCAAQSNRLVFKHQTGVQGAKAGALNIALEHTDPLATHVVTVDADYVVHHNFLSLAAGALRRTGADYVQFPQSYTATATVAPGIDAELEEYFRTNAAVADEAEALLLTGTLCVISKDALITAGGWSGSTTTEDAELGVRLCNAGYSGRFINQVVGQGLLPFSLKDLEKQRYRWCSGNFQTLLRHIGTILMPSGTFSLHKRLVVVSQLTAWFHLALIPCALLVVWLVAGQGNTVGSTLAAGIIVLGLCDNAIRVLVRGLRDRLPLAVLLNALACRIALAPQSAKASFDAMAGGRLQFVVTDKSGGKSHSASNLHIWHLLLFVTVIALMVVTQPNNPLVFSALLTLALPLPAALVTEKSLRAYRETIVPSMREAIA